MFRWLYVWALLPLFSGMAHAQVNTEQYRTEQTDAASHRVELDFGYKQGNVDLLTAGIDVGSTWHNENSSLLFIVDGSFAAKRTLADYATAPDIDLLDSEAHYINKVLAHGRWNRQLTDSWTMELFGQVEKNDFLLMDRRMLAGLGPRLRLLNSEHVHLAWGLAYMLEHERLNATSIDLSQQAQDTLAHRATSYLSGRVNIGESSSFGGTVYAQPRLTQPSDIRVLGELQLSVGINDVVALGVEFVFRHDSDPPTVAASAPPLEPTDIALGHSLTIQF